MRYGCPYWKYNFDKDREDCKLTNQEVLCDGDFCTFTYEDCPNYKSALKPVNGQLEGQISIDDLAVPK